MILKGDVVLDDEVIAHRERVRSVYSSKNGRQELFNMIIDSGILDEITPDRLSVRNYMIKKLEEMGMLDEHIVRIMIDHFFDIDPCSVEKAEYLMSRNEEKNGYE